MNFAPFAFQQQVVSAAAFNPNNLSDLTFWIDMSDSNFYTTSGSDITAIYSKVAGSTNTTLSRVNASNGYYQLASSLSNGALNSAKVTSRPTTYRSSTWNNGVATDATFGPKTNTTDYPDGSMFVVTNRGTISSAGYIISRYNGSTDRGVQYDLDTGSPNTDIIGYDFNSPTYQYYNTTATPNNILTRINNGATSTIYRNGVLQESGSKNDTQNLSTRQFHNLGIYGSPTGTGDSTPINTQYCEVIIYNRVLTESEINQVTTYLSNKWNIPTLLNVPTSGLTLWLDAGLTQSYPGTGTSWFDLSGNNNTGTLTNGAVYNSDNGGSIYFDGTNDYISFSSVTGLPTGNSPYTIVQFFKFPTAIRRNITFFTGTFGTTKRVNAVDSLSSGESGGVGGFNNYWWAADYIQVTPLSDNAWYNHVATYNGSTTREMFKNNSSIGTSASNNLNITDNSTLTVGRGYAVGYEYTLGYISAVMYYNRKLSNTELTQIWDAYKTRYGYTNIVTDNLVLNYDAGLLASYPTTGTSWFNLQGTTLTSTLTNGPTFSTNNGGTIVFDGTNDYTTGPDNAILDFGTDPWTIECWVRINADSSANNDGNKSATIINALNKSGTLNGWNLVVRGDTTSTGQALIFERQISGTGTYPRYTLPAPGGVQTYLNKNQLYQIGISHSAADGTKFFIDGVYYDADIDLTGVVNGTNALEVGRLGITGYQQYLNGGVAIARIYKGKQLSAAELLQNYNAGINRI